MFVSFIINFFQFYSISRISWLNLKFQCSNFHIFCILVKLIASENNTNTRIPTSSVAIVSLTIIDINDNSPQFPVQPKIFNVSEDEPIGYVIAKITANDTDSGDFGDIVFSLEDNGLDGTFNISEQVRDVLVYVILGKV